MKKGKWIWVAAMLAVVLLVAVLAIALPRNDSDANLEELAARTAQLRDAKACGVTLEITEDGAQLRCEQPVDWYNWYRLEQLDANGDVTTLREEKAAFSTDGLTPGEYRLTMLCWLPEDVTFPGILRAESAFTLGKNRLFGGEDARVALLTWDGAQQMRTSYDLTPAQSASLLEALCNTAIWPVDSVSVSTDQMVYGIKCYKDEEPYVTRYLLANGFLLTEEGEAYQFDFDFERWAAEAGPLDDTTLQNPRGICYMPCIRQLAQTPDGWRTEWLAPAPEPEPPAEITAELVEANEEVVTFTLTNHGAHPWDYGYSAILHVQVAGEWYLVPYDWGFTSLGYSLGSGKTEEKTCGIHWLYGDLPAGHYRLVWEGVPVEFDLPAQ